MKLCCATQLYMLALEIVSHRDMKMCCMIFLVKGNSEIVSYIYIACQF